MKPDYITETDWQLLKEKYSNHMDEVLKKLNEDYPVQYLIGSVPFLNAEIKVDNRALIPRFETEYLVSKIIDKFKKEQNLKIIELGTGSGCIAIALKKNLSCQVTTVDISKLALELAKENAIANKVDINFIHKSMFDVSYEDYDILISNPPYVSIDEYVSPNTKYEPSLALYAKDDGMEFYEKIIEKVSKTIRKPKNIIFEIGAVQGKKIQNLKDIYLQDYELVIEKDLTDRDRFAFFTKIE